jgi:isoquinoline 1-oxidoreductase alpha subunit
MAKISVNGKVEDIEVDASTPLLWVLREHLGLTGTKYSCGIGVCGSCTVHLNGKAVRSCTIPVGSLKPSQKITTIEGLSKDGSHPIQKAWNELDVPQCGYCQPGMIMSAVALLKDKPIPTDADIDAGITNICRCGTFNRVREGIHLAAKTNKDGGQNV